MVRRAIEHLPPRFTIGDIKRAYPGVSYPMLQRALADLRKEMKICCIGRSSDAQWERLKG
jgi:hypothetical protein